MLLVVAHLTGLGCGVASAGSGESGIAKIRHSTMRWRGTARYASEEAMATIFGIEEHDTRRFFDGRKVCLPYASDGKPDLHSVVAPVKNDDLVFIKHYTPNTGLQIKAIGIVRSDFPAEGMADACFPVEWVWRGARVLESFDEELHERDDAFYEEHDISVQRQIIDLLPARFQLRREW